MEDFPVEHLSAQSLALAITCSEKWRLKYVCGLRAPSLSAFLVGGAFHKTVEDYYGYKLRVREPRLDELQDLYKLHWTKRMLDSEGETMFWAKGSDEESEFKRGLAAVEAYYPVAQTIQPVAVEQEFYHYVEGVGVPIKGYIDVETENSVYDTKTSTRPCGLKPEWRMQDRIYKLVSGKDALWHVVVSNKEGAYIITEHENHKLVSLYTDQEARMTEHLIRRIYDRLKFYWDNYGPDEVWEGAISSKSACGDCAFRQDNCAYWAHENRLHVG